VSDNARKARSFNVEKLAGTDSAETAEVGKDAFGRKGRQYLRLRVNPKTGGRFASPVTLVSKESCVKRQKMTAKDCGLKVIRGFRE
jgi:hypothetical protein